MSAAVSCIKGCGRRARSRGLCNACYMRWLERQKAYGRFESIYVPAAPARRHVLALIEAGVSRRCISVTSGVNRKQITYLLTGRTDRNAPPCRRITRATAERLLGVPLPTDVRALKAVAAAHDLVSAVGASRRLQALVAFGWPAEHLAERLSGRVSRCVVHELVGERREKCLARVDRAVADLFDTLQFELGPSDRARNQGVSRGWPLPMEWDEDTIDDPSGTAVDGQRWTPTSSVAERVEQVHHLTLQGLTAEQIADRLKVTARTVQRDRAKAVA